MSPYSFSTIELARSLCSSGILLCIAAFASHCTFGALLSSSRPDLSLATALAKGAVDAWVKIECIFHPAVVAKRLCLALENVVADATMTALVTLPVFLVVLFFLGSTGDDYLHQVAWCPDMCVTGPSLWLALMLVLDMGEVLI